MKALNIFGGLAVLIVLSLIVVANFSASESRFACDGKIADDEIEQDIEILLKLETYRWWVGFWSDSHGSAWVEIPNQTVAYFGHVTKAGDLLQFWDSFHDPNNFSGNFSTLSYTIGVKIPIYGVFGGKCRPVEN